MPYIIKGPVPTEAIGDCPWCDKRYAIIHLTAATLEGKLCADYVCAKCLLELDEIREKNARGKLNLANNPEVEIASDC